MYKNRNIITILLCMVLLFGITVLTGVSAEKEVYINGIDADYPPHAYVDESGKPAGFDVEALDWIAEEMGFEVVHQPTAWDGIVSSLLAEKIDMVFSGMSITEERKEKVNFTIPYWSIDQAISVRSDSDLNAIEIFMGDYTVGTQRGCTAAMWIEDNLINQELFPKDSLKLYEGFSLAVQDVLNGRVDAAMMDDVMVEDAIRKGMDIKVIGTIKTGEEYGVAVRKDDSELLELLNEGIKRIMNSPRWDELKAKYFQAQ
ncbi:MAG: basic amino acid ABC transporter substrate-binding protein [Candidatus Caldatribacteriota bacterium]|jgi:polar amino acid transport system substrate-binding protein|nr:basic amino acid ABC transporter substrate-binding protein [Atribacterota bacterium]MDD3031130.1 basic amino acid ABC transporter substrate-binding protein [Atribacterota bacterium]MDD3640864.1 basic amino acid ABC transporter substrate-binding protein [Atribacterota bacterium]MDD4289025.1 basic amino acid ABC transporter substrate-binding protein [Atribacterota bacterium]MDD4765831.1 basic amino acid ABC transporter substrate-binding protein [Atribacterota bacterium]